METITVKSFLESQGIDLNKATFLAVVDGYMRQPDLIHLFESFHKAKLAELDLKIVDFNGIESN